MLLCFTFAPLTVHGWNLNGASCQSVHHVLHLNKKRPGKVTFGDSLTDSTATHSSVMKTTNAPFKIQAFIFKPFHLACPPTAPQRNGNKSAMTNKHDDKKVFVKVSLGLCVSVHQLEHAN